LIPRKFLSKLFAALLIMLEFSIELF